MELGIIHLIPVPLSNGTLDQLSQSVIEQAKKIDHFLAENAKSARKFIKMLDHPLKQAEIEVREIDLEISIEDLDWALKKCKKGIHIGLVSEAGLPCIADPGNKLVSFAHKNNLIVQAYPGPNSMLMALMASGLNGQEFSFLGYMPRKKEELREKLIQLGKLSAQKKTSYIFMETPYRNKQLLEIAASVLPSELILSISVSLGTPFQKSVSKKVKDWKESNFDFVVDVPAVFVLGREEQ